MVPECPPQIVALIAAHNEERVIVATLQSLLAQRRRPDRIVVAADNCTDRTAELARSVPGVTVYETQCNRARKAGALNQAWRRHCGAADLVVCIDADTILDAGAVAEWEVEFDGNSYLGGSSGRCTMLVDDRMTWREKVFVRLQRAEYARGIDRVLARGRNTSVLPGAAACFRNDALRQVAGWRRRQGLEGAGGPWHEGSAVEDYEITYRLRERGWQTKISASVRAYTDAMTNLKSLWAQRMKWQTGTVNDLLDFGVNRLTIGGWCSQVLALAAIVLRVVFVVMMGLVFTMGMGFQFNPIWLIPAGIVCANEIRQTLRIPFCRPADVVLAALLVPQEIFGCIRMAWTAAAWTEVLCGRLRSRLGRRRSITRTVGRDRWVLQAQAEATRRVGVEAGGDHGPGSRRAA